MTALLLKVSRNASCVLGWLPKVALVIALTSSAAWAEEEQSFKVGIKIDGVAKPFTNVAKKHGVKMRIDRTKCSADVKATCQYEISGNVSLLVTGSKEKSPIDGLTLVGGQGTDAGSLMISMGLLMGVFDPELSKPGRGELTNKLFDAANTGEVGTAEGRDAKYSFRMSSVGIFFTMEPLVAAPAAPASTLGGKLKTLPGSNYVIVWKDKASHDKALEIINSGVTEEKVPLLEELVACRADAGTSVSLTDAGWVTHDILILDGPRQGCRGNVPAEEVELSK